MYFGAVKQYGSHTNYKNAHLNRNLVIELSVPVENFYTVEPPVAPLASDPLSSATSFPKYQKCPSQITLFGTSCKQPLLVSDRGHF